MPITKNFYSFNNTAYIDNSSQFNFSKNTTNKITVTYAPEKIEQTENRLVQTFVGNQQFSETKSAKKPVIHHTRFNIKNELIWMVTPNKQIKYEVNYSNENVIGVDDGLLNNGKARFDTDNKKTALNHLINFTTYLPKSRLLNIACFYEYQKNNELLLSEGIGYNGVLFSNLYGAVKDLEQQKINAENNFGAYVKLIKHHKNHSFTFQPSYKFLQGRFYSNVSANSNTGFSFAAIDSFHNQYKYYQSQLSVPIRYKFDAFNDKYSFSIQGEPFVILQQKFHFINNPSYVGVNGDADLRYNLKNKKAINVRASKRYTIANAEFTLQSNIIKSNRNIQTKSSLITENNSYNISASFYNSAFNKKSKNSYAISYTINEPNYLSNSIYNNLFVQYSFFSITNTNSAFYSFVKNELNIKKWKMKFEQMLSFNTSKTNLLQNNLAVKSLSKNLTFENKIKTKFISSFNFDWINSFTYINSKRDNNSTAYTNYLNSSTLIINFNYMKKINIDFSMKDYYFYTPSLKQKKHLFFSNISYKQLVKNNKIRLSLELNNITNQQKFGTQLISPTQYFEAATVLIPFYTLAKIEFLL